MTPSVANPQPVTEPEAPGWIGFLLACAYPERIASGAARAATTTVWPTAAVPNWTAATA